VVKMSYMFIVTRVEYSMLMTMSRPSIGVSDLIKDKADDNDWTWYTELPAGVPPSTDGQITYDGDETYTFHPAMITLTKEQVDTTRRVPARPQPNYWDEETRQRMNKQIKPAAMGKINEWLHAPGGLVQRVLAKKYPKGLGGRSRRKGLRRTRRNK